MAIAVRRQPVPAPAQVERASHVDSRAVWRELDRASFAVVGYVTPAGEARSSGIVFKTAGRRLYTAVAPESWKARHIALAGKVSVTVTVRRGGLLTLALPIPPATISFHGRAIVHAPGTLDLAEVSSELASLVPAERKSGAAVIEIVPEGDFLTYGLGVSLMDMAKPELARGSAPVFTEEYDDGSRPSTPGASVYVLMALALVAAAAGIWLPPAGIAAALVAVIAVVLASRAATPQRRRRIALFAITGFIALTAIPGGAGLLRGAFPISTSWLAGSPFSDFTIPGLALLVLCGGTATLAWLTTFVERRWALAMSAIAGLTMAGYEIVEILVVDRNVAGTDLGLALAMQLVWMAAGVIVGVLAWSLLRAERSPG